MPSLVERTIEDLRFALRAWRRTPGAAAAAVATLALGIGATTSVFTVVSSTGPVESLVPSIRQAVREVNPNQAAFGVATMEQVVDASIGRQKLYAWLLTVFAAVGAALASLGVYAVMSYVVTLRTRELGVRVALGASAGRVVRTILGRGALLAGMGVALGFAGALGLMLMLEGTLYGVSASDPATFAAIAILLAAVAVAACLIPARRAAAVDPVVALRAD